MILSSHYRQCRAGPSKVPIPSFGAQGVVPNLRQRCRIKRRGVRRPASGPPQHLAKLPHGAAFTIRSPPAAVPCQDFLRQARMAEESVAASHRLRRATPRLHKRTIMASRRRRQQIRLGTTAWGAVPRFRDRRRPPHPCRPFHCRRHFYNPHLRISYRHRISRTSLLARRVRPPALVLLLTSPGNLHLWQRTSQVRRQLLVPPCRTN